MQAQRKHDEKMKLTSSFADLSKNGQMVVAGKTGSEVLGFYNQTMKDVFEA